MLDRLVCNDLTQGDQLSHLPSPTIQRHVRHRRNCFSETLICPSHRNTVVGNEV